MKRALIFSVWLASALHSRAADDVVGRGGDLQINATEVRASLAALGAQENAAVLRDPALLNQLVRSLLVQRLLLKEAESKQHDKEPEVAARLARARDALVTESYLAAVSQPPADWPGEGEINAAYEKAKPSLGVPKSWRLSQIFIAAPQDTGKDAADKAQGRLDAVVELLNAGGADFSKIAAAHSEEEASASRGGEIGWLAESQIQPGIREKLGALKVDAVSAPIRLDDGWHIIRVLDAREPFTPTLGQVRTQLVAKLRSEKARENSQAYVARLLSDNPVAINEIALGQLVNEAKK